MSRNQPDGYLALPASGKGKPVLVLHAWWGLNDTVKAFSDRLAEAGFVVFAPDLYHGKVTDQISEAETLTKTINKNVDQELSEAIRFLSERAGQAEGGIAVVGFSLGAAYAIDLSTREPDIRSVVIFYGTGEGDFSKSNAEYLGHFAANDPYEEQEFVEGLENGIRQAGRPVTFYSYPNTGHWFFEPDRTDAYNEEASTLAWDRTLEFLKRSS